MGIPGGASDYNHYLRAHETAHFAQQRVEGWGHFYWITAGDYEEHGMSQIYREPFTFENFAEKYALDRVGYYYPSLNKRQTRFPHKMIITH